MLAHVEVVGIGGGISRGQIVGAEGRMQETLIIAFSAGPLARSSFRLQGLARDNLQLSSPVEIPMVGTLRRAPASPAPDLDKAQREIMSACGELRVIDQHVLGYDPGGRLKLAENHLGEALAALGCGEPQP